MTKDMQDLMDRPTISVDAAARIIGLSRGAAYGAVKAGTIESVCFGKRKMVLTAPLRRKLGIEAAQ